MIPAPKRMVRVRAIGREERRAVHEVAKIPVLRAILRIPGTKVGIGGCLRQFVDQIVGHSVHADVAIGASRIAVVGHITRTSTV